MTYCTQFESTIYVILQMDFGWEMHNDVSSFDFTCRSIYLWTNEKRLLAYCNVTSCILTVLKAEELLHLEDGGSAFLLKVGTFIRDYMTSHRTKQRPPFTGTSTSNLKSFGLTKSLTFTLLENQFDRLQLS